VENNEHNEDQSMLSGPCFHGALAIHAVVMGLHVIMERGCCIIGLITLTSILCWWSRRGYDSWLCGRAAPPGYSDLTHTISMSPHAHCFLFTGKSDVLAQMGFLEVCAVLILRIHQFCCPCFIAEICVAVLKSAQISIRPPQTV